MLSYIGGNKRYSASDRICGCRFFVRSASDSPAAMLSRHSGKRKLMQDSDGTRAQVTSAEQTDAGNGTYSTDWVGEGKGRAGTRCRYCT